MHSIAFLFGAAAACFAPLAAADGAAGHAWGYTTTNASIASPTHWAEYYPTCAGTRQSPIDISTTGQSAATSLPLTFDGKCQRFSLSVNEEAYKGSVTGGSFSLVATWDVADAVSYLGSPRQDRALHTLVARRSTCSSSTCTPHPSTL